MVTQGPTMPCTTPDDDQDLPPMAASAPSDVLAERYGRPRESRGRRVVVLAAVLGALATAWTAWVGWDHAQEQVSAQLRSYAVTGDTSTEVTLEINRQTGSAVDCQVYAQAGDHSRVGELVVRIPAGDEGRVLVTETITTQRRAVNGVLGSCTVVD